MDARPRPGATNGSNYFKTSVIFTLVAGVGQCELSHCGARSPAKKGKFVLDQCSHKCLLSKQVAASKCFLRRKNNINDRSAQRRKNVLVPRLQTLYCLSKKVVLYAGPLAVNGNRAGCMHVD